MNYHIYAISFHISLAHTSLLRSRSILLNCFLDFQQKYRFLQWTHCKLKLFFPLGINDQYFLPNVGAFLMQPTVQVRQLKWCILNSFFSWNALYSITKTSVFQPSASLLNHFLFLSPRPWSQFGISHVTLINSLGITCTHMCVLRMCMCVRV